VARLEAVVQHLDRCLPPSEAEVRYAAELRSLEHKAAALRRGCQDVCLTAAYPAHVFMHARSARTRTLPTFVSALAPHCDHALFPSSSPVSLSSFSPCFGARPPIDGGRLRRRSGVGTSWKGTRHSTPCRHRCGSGVWRRTTTN